MSETTTTHEPLTLAVVVEAGYRVLAEVPTGCWDGHKRSKNWLALIEKDPTKPGGLARVFWTKARGDGYYLIHRDACRGCAIELGADYYTASGRPDRHRWYGVIVHLTDRQLVVRAFDSAAQAIDAAEEIVALDLMVANELNRPPLPGEIKLPAAGDPIESESAIRSAQKARDVAEVRALMARLGVSRADLEGTPS